MFFYCSCFHFTMFVPVSASFHNATEKFSDWLLSPSLSTNNQHSYISYPMDARMF